MSKSARPVFASNDIKLMKEMILFLVQTQDDITVPKEKKSELESLYHRLSRIDNNE